MAIRVNDEPRLISGWEIAQRGNLFKAWRDEGNGLKHQRSQYKVALSKKYLLQHKMRCNTTTILAVWR